MPTCPLVLSSLKHTSFGYPNDYVRRNGHSDGPVILDEQLSRLSCRCAGQGPRPTTPIPPVLASRQSPDETEVIVTQKMTLHRPESAGGGLETSPKEGTTLAAKSPTRLTCSSASSTVPLPIAGARLLLRSIAGEWMTESCGNI